MPKPLRRITMRDIAEKTGYTVNTISRALQNKTDISTGAREKIQLAAKELGYVHNSMASALRSGRSGTLALIIGELGNPKFATLAQHIESAARAHQYSVIILCTHERGDLEAQAIQTALEHRVDGIIINPTQESDQCITQMKASGVPFVLLERYFENHDVDCVLCDEVEGGALAAKHLLAAGHRRIVHLMGPERISSARLRREGFLQATSTLPPGQALVLPMKNARANVEALRGLETQGFTGAFFFSDMGLLDAIAHLQQQPMPQLTGFAFVGFDNIQGLFSFPSPLCSIDPSSAKLCDATVRLLLHRIAGKTTPPEKLVFPVQLVCRASCHHLKGLP